MKLYSFVEKELQFFRDNCNFTPDERQYFELRAKLYSEMARQEAQHARNLHKMYQESVDEMRWVPEESLEEWEHCVAKMSETLALVELMLSK